MWTSVRLTDSAGHWAAAIFCVTTVVSRSPAPGSHTGRTTPGRQPGEVAQYTARCPAAPPIPASWCPAGRHYQRTSGNCAAFLSSCPAVAQLQRRWLGVVLAAGRGDESHRAGLAGRLTMGRISVLVAGRVQAHLDDPSVVLAETGQDAMKGTPGQLRCGCRHGRDAHRHYRPGSDCALCECPRWAPWNPALWLARRRA